MQNLKKLSQKLYISVIVLIWSELDGTEGNKRLPFKTTARVEGHKICIIPLLTGNYRETHLFHLVV